MLPEKIYKGTLLNFSETLSDYLPSAGWSLHYALINASQKIQLNSTASGENHLFNYESASQNDWMIGSFTFQKYVKKNGVSPVLLQTGKVKVEPFFETTAVFDSRSFSQKMLDACEALLLDRGAAIDYEYSFRGKTLRSMQFEELIRAKNYFANEVAKEEKQAAIDAGEEPSGRIFFGFE